jgi:hypothetical protein
MVGGTLVGAASFVYALMVSIDPGLESPAFKPWMMFALAVVIYLHGSYAAWRDECERADRAEARLHAIERPDGVEVHPRAHDSA